jgi:hypothetical protein
VSSPHPNLGIRAHLACNTSLLSCPLSILRWPSCHPDLSGEHSL